VALALKNATSANNPYTSQALAILQQNCVSCHTSESGPDDVYDVTDVNHLLSFGLVVSGQPGQSLLYQQISEGLMPPTGPLSAIDQEAISNQQSHLH
jgi:hypothetical protein